MGECGLGGGSLANTKHSRCPETNLMKPPSTHLTVQQLSSLCSQVRLSAAVPPVQQTQRERVCVCVCVCACLWLCASVCLSAPPLSLSLSSLFSRCLWEAYWSARAKTNKQRGQVKWGIMFTLFLAYVLTAPPLFLGVFFFPFSLSRTNIQQKGLAAWTAQSDFHPRASAQRSLGPQRPDLRHCEPTHRP